MNAAATSTARQSQPQTGDDAFQRALALHRAGHDDRAEAGYRDCLAQQPDHPHAWNNLGVLLEKRNRTEAAVLAYRRSLQYQPGTRSSLANLAKVLTDIGEYEEVLRIRAALLRADPHNRELLADYCVTLRHLNRHDEVIERIDAAEAVGNANARGIMQRAVSHLINFDFANGFADYEARYDADMIKLPANPGCPRWRGEPVAGRRILVTAEQGFGDALIASRFVPGLAAMGAEVHLQVKKPLRRLMANLEGMHTMVSEKTPPTGDYDFYTPNISLAHWVGCPGGDPPPPPRLTIPEDCRERARDFVAPFRDRLKVGIVWTGSLTFKGNRRRSASPSHFLGLAELPGVQLFSLYKGPAATDLRTSGMAGHVVDAGSRSRDFAETAAVIDAMDMLITTDTGVVHVAGAMGKTVWLLLPPDAFWIYGNGDRTPWYPTMRLWRQRRPGDWASLFTRIESALDERLAGA